MRRGEKGWRRRGTRTTLTERRHSFRVRWKLNASQTCWIRQEEGNALSKSPPILPPIDFFSCRRGEWRGDVADLVENDFKPGGYNLRRRRDAMLEFGEKHCIALWMVRCDFYFFFLFLRIKVESRVWILRFRREMKKSI